MRKEDTMHKLQMYENLRDMLEREVMEIEKTNDLNPQSLDHLYKLMTAIKVADKCLEREEGGASGRSYGNSNRSYGSYGNSNEGRSNDYSMDRSYERGNSRDNFRSNSYRGGSYESGRSNEYSGNSRQKMIDRLGMLMDEATNENERQAIMDCINRM